MNKPISALLLGATLLVSGWAQADGNMDMIPELKEIERLAAEQEAKIRAQSEALKATEAEKAKAEASAPAPATVAKVETPAPAAASEPKAKPAKPKAVVAKAPEKKDYWLMQERLYTYP